jgi:hypothetical protein
MMPRRSYRKPHLSTFSESLHILRTFSSSPHILTALSAIGRKAMRVKALRLNRERNAGDATPA